jgi:type VI secretion system protein ImpH
MDPARRAEESDLDSSPMERVLQEDACSFEFFQAVTLLSRLRLDHKPVGRFSNPADEAVHFCVNNQLAFPASQIQQIECEDDAPAAMRVNFIGLTGPMGVLPYCYTELILEQLRYKDSSLRDFLDIFNHRLISLFYRAWEKYHFPVTYRLGDEDRFTRHLLDLIGLGTSGLQERQSVPDDAYLHYVALLGAQVRSATALEAILRDYFEVPVEIEQFTGAWYRLDRTTQCSMQEQNTDSELLGGGAVVGDEIWDQQSSVRIKLGPMGLEQYSDFLPQGSAYEPLKAITKFFSNDEFDFEVQLLLDRDEVPACNVGFEHDVPPRLGWVTWLKSKPLDRDPGDTILRL